MARSLRCPSCALVLSAPDNVIPTCPRCGFRGPVAPPLPPPPPMPTPQPVATAPRGPVRPPAVTTVAVLGFVQAGVGAITSLFLMVGGAIFAALLSAFDGDKAGAHAAETVVLIGVLVLLLSIAQAIAAGGLLGGKPWARVAQVAISAAFLGLSLLGVANGVFVVVLTAALNVAAAAILLGGEAQAYFDAAT